MSTLYQIDAYPLPYSMIPPFPLVVVARFFVYLSKEGDRMKFDLNFATHEARKCADFLSQAQHHLARARRADDEERTLKERQELEREELAKKQHEEEVRGHAEFAQVFLSLTPDICNQTA